MSLAVLIFGLLALAGAIVLVVLVLGQEEKEPTGVAGNLEAIEKVYAPGVANRDAARRDPLAGSPVLRLGRVLASRLSPSGAMDLLQKRLDVAGNPGVWTPERVMSFKGLGLMVVGVVGGVLGLNGGVGTVLLFAVCGAAAGFYLPDILLYNAGLKRQDEFRKTLPDILDLLVVSVEAGLGFDAALSRVAKSITGPLSGEFARLMQEMQIGKSREAALQAMATRTSVDELRTFVSALVQASELGIPMGNVLREQAKEMRLKRRQLAEEKAQKVPVKITFPVMLCILPALFIIVLGPGILSIIGSGLFH